MDKRRMKLAGLAITGTLILLLAAPAGAQRITGTVQDDQGAPLPDVRVTLSGPGIPGTLSRTTGADGDYRFIALTPGSYDLSFSLAGFTSEDRNGVGVSADAATVEDVTLKAVQRQSVAVTVDSGTTRVLTQQTSASTSTPEGNPGDESAEEDTTVTTRADLTIAIGDSVDPVVAGTPLTYTVTVTNKGPSHARYVEVTETPSPGVSFVATAGCAEDPAGVPVCTLDTIPAGGSKTYTVQFTVDPSTTGGITGQVSVSSQTTEAGPGDESAAEETQVEALADLTLTRPESMASVTAGMALTYSRVVTNRGPSDAREVVIDDTLPLGTRLDWTKGCAEDPDGSPNCTLGTIRAGASKTITLAVTVDPATTDQLTDRAAVRSGTEDPSPGNESATEDTVVEALADLVVTRGDSTDPVVAGTPLTYTTTVTNNGPSDAVGVVVTETLPAGVILVATGGCAEDPGGVPTCTLGTIPTGSSRQFTVAVAVDSGTLGSLADRAVVTAQTTEASPGDEEMTENTAVEARADLVVTSTDSVDPVVAGLPLTYTVMVRNNGPSDARDVAIGSSLPAGVTFRSTAGCPEDDRPGGGVPTCTLGTIPADSEKQYEIAVLVSPDATGILTNQASASSSTMEGRAPAPPPSPPVEAQDLRAAEPQASPDTGLAALARAWAQAWADQRTEDYLAFYASSFVPTNGVSPEEWQRRRRAKLSSPETITLMLSAIDAEQVGADRARISFDQAYRSNLYSDDVRKTLELVREDGEWRIAEERVE